MGFFEELSAAIDPEAFSADLWNHPDREEAVRLEARQRKVREGLQTGLSRLGDRFKIVPIPVPSYDGDYYAIDGYGEGRKGSLFLNEKRLGAFLVTLLKMGGTVCSISAFNAEYKDSHVSAIIKLHPDRKAAFEAATGLTLRAPPVLVPA